MKLFYCNKEELIFPHLYQESQQISLLRVVRGFRGTFEIETHWVDEAFVSLELLQHLAIHIVHIKPPDSYQAVVAPSHHQVLGAGMVLSAVHEGRVRQHLLSVFQKLFHVPLSEKEEDAVAAASLCFLFVAFSDFIYIRNSRPTWQFHPRRRTAGPYHRWTRRDHTQFSDDRWKQPTLSQKESHTLEKRNKENVFFYSLMRLDFSFFFFTDLQKDQVNWLEEAKNSSCVEMRRCLPTTGKASLSAQAAASLVPAWENRTVKQPILPPRKAKPCLLGIRQIYHREYFTSF